MTPLVLLGHHEIQEVFRRITPTIKRRVTHVDDVSARSHSFPAGEGVTGLLRPDELPFSFNRLLGLPHQCGSASPRRSLDFLSTEPRPTSRLFGSRKREVPQIKSQRVVWLPLSIASRLSGDRLSTTLTLERAGHVHADRPMLLGQAPDVGQGCA